VGYGVWGVGESSVMELVSVQLLDFFNAEASGLADTHFPHFKCHTDTCLGVKFA
jgi:hypothetical protein